MSRRIRWALWVLAGTALLAAALLLWPGFAAWWLVRVACPAGEGLAGFFAGVPFPVAEPLILLGGGWALSRLFRGRRGLRSLCLAASLLLMGYAVLWLPALTAPTASPYEAKAASTQALAAARDHLWAELGEDAAAFDEDDDEILAEAARGVSMLTEAPSFVKSPGKFARYPEWMSRLNLAGLYMPYTGEVILRGSAPRWAVYFTACHELAHRAGIGDEGQANIAAWRACMALGGNFAASARLWAVRYIDAALAGAGEGGYGLLAHYVANLPGYA